MSTPFRIAACSLLLASAAVSQGGVVINEFRYDDSGATDDREFVELYNASSQPVDLSGWLLDASDAATNPDNPDYALAQGTVLAPGAFWVLGAATVPGVDQILVHPGTGLGQDLFENDTESLTLRDALGNIVDTVVYEGHGGVWAPDLVEGTPIWGGLESLDGQGTSFARLRDGWDTGRGGRDFRVMPSTPGATNTRQVLNRRADDFDGIPRGTGVAGFGASAGALQVIDPQVVDNANPAAIPASPQGGNAAALVTPPGAGSITTWLGDVDADLGCELLVWLDATPTPQGGRRTWSIGVRGSSDGQFAHPDPGRRTGAPSANGNTGVTWTYVVDHTSAVLYLVDHGDGGSLHLILARIEIVPGQNDGWQRLRLLSSGERVWGLFGDDGRGGGTTLTGWMRAGFGGVWMGARQTGPGQASPLRVDQLLIGRDTQTRIASGGSGCTGNCPTKNSTPKRVDTEASEDVPAGEYAFRVDYDPAEPFSVTQICFWTSRYMEGPPSLPTVSIFPLDGAGTGPATVPLATYALNPPGGTPEDVEDWWATAPFPAFMPTDDFFISFDHRPAVHGVHAPIGENGDPLAVWSRSGPGIAFAPVATDRRWAWALVCPTDTADPVGVEITPPLIGEGFRIGLAGGRPQSPAALSFGVSTQSWNGTPLPFDLGRFGAPGCAVNNSVEVALNAITDGAGNARIVLPLPAVTALAGNVVHQQWFVLDPRANRFGLAVSNSLASRIGEFR